MKKIENAQIVSVKLGGFDGGYTMLTYAIVLAFADGGSIAYGGHNMGGMNQPSLAAYDLLKLLEITDSGDWSELKGKYVRVEYETDDNINITNIRLGHLVKNIWHDYKMMRPKNQHDKEEEVQ